MSSRSIAIAVTALALGLGVGRASADPARLEAAVRLYEEGAFSEAMEAFESLIREGGCDRPVLAAAYLHLGILRAGARDAEGAALAFEAALSLDPRARLPAGSSPTVGEPFAAAVVRRGDAPALGIRLDVPERVARGENVEVVVGVVGDSAQLAAEARATTGGSGTSTPWGPPFRMSLAATEMGTLAIEASLHDAHGSLLAAERAAVEVVAARPPGSAGGPASRRARSPIRAEDRDDDRDDGGSILGSVWFWGGVVALVGGAVAIGLVATAEPDGAEFGEIRVRP